jgi:hypothetical protein
VAGLELDGVGGDGVEDFEVVAQDRGGFLEGFVRGDASVGGDLQDELVVVGLVAERVDSTEYFTRVTGEKRESTGMEPMACSAFLFSSADAQLRPTVTSRSA